MGQRILRREDSRFLIGNGSYVENIDLPGALHAVFIRSHYAHARILEIDVSAARELPATQVFTAADVDLGPFQPPHIPGIDQRMGRPFLAHDVVRFVGDIVAIVVSERRDVGVDAADLIRVEYEPLPAVVRPEQALAGDVLLFPEAGTNVCASHPAERDEHLFDACEVVVSGRLVSQRMAACPLEARACAAAVGDDGRLTLWLSTQTPHQDRNDLATILGLEPADVRVVAPDVGGGFGAKLLGVEEVLVAWLARRLARPVRWAETRSENMIAMPHGRGAVLEFTIGGTRDGRVEAYRLRSLQDTGAYPRIGAILPGFTALMASGVYAIPKIETEFTSVVTNTTPVGPFRGAGRPEATQAIERAMDLFALEVGLDPAEVRRRNLFASDAFPLTTASGATYDCGDYERALDLALEASDYEALREEQRLRREAGGTLALGIGVSVYVEITNGLAESELGDVEITPEGEAILRTGSFSHGQGHETTFAMIVADRLGLPLESVRVIKGDTDEVRQGTGTYGSKSTQIGGVAARGAAHLVAERARELAAEHLEASVDDVVLDTEIGAFHVIGSRTPSVSWKELATSLGQRGTAGRAARRGDLQRRRSDVPVRRARRGCRGRHRDGPGRAPPARRSRRRRDDDQPRHRRRPGARRRCDRRGPGAVRGVRLRRRREPPDWNLRELFLPVRRRAAVVRRRVDGDANAAQHARGEGDRRVRDDRCDPGGSERSRGCARAVRRSPHRHAGERRAGVAGDPAGPRRPMISAVTAQFGTVGYGWSGVRAA